MTEFLIAAGAGHGAPVCECLGGCCETKATCDSQGAIDHAYMLKPTDRDEAQMRALQIFPLVLPMLTAGPALAGQEQGDPVCYDLAVVGTIDDVGGGRGAEPRDVFAPARLDLRIHVRHVFGEEDVGREILVRGVIMTDLPARDDPLLFLLKRAGEGYQFVGWEFADRNWLWLGRFKPPEDYGEDARLPSRCG